MIVENIEFIDNNIKYIIEVEYTNELKLPRIWNAKLLEPKDIDINLKNIKSGVFFGMHSKNKKYVLKNVQSDVDLENEINIYFNIKDKIIYNYLNYFKIKKTNEEIININKKIDLKFKPLIEKTNIIKIQSKRKFKNNELSEQEYKETIRNKENLKFRINKLKNKIKSKFFDQCGKLK